MKALFEETNLGEYSLSFVEEGNDFVYCTFEDVELPNIKTDDLGMVYIETALPVSGVEVTS